VAHVTDVHTRNIMNEWMDVWMCGLMKKQIHEQMVRWIEETNTWTNGQVDSSYEQTT